MNRETPIKESIQKYLKTLKHCVVDRRDAIGVNYKKGMPDLWCVKDGIHYEIETKDPLGDTSIMQDKQKIKLEDAGCVYILAKSLDDVRNIIK